MCKVTKFSHDLNVKFNQDNFTRRAKSVKSAKTLEMSARAKTLEAQGFDVCNLSAGLPEIDTPFHIKEAAMKALQVGKTKYSHVEGEIELRQAIVNKLERENGLHYGLENIVISNGAKQSLYNTVQALIQPTDEVIISSPYWLSFPDIVKLAEGIPVFIQGKAENHYKMTAKQLEEAITPKTKMLIFNTPSNPTGAVYTLEEIQALACVIERHPNIFVISDEIFEKIIFDNNRHYSIAAINSNIRDRVITINGFSKIYSMTGWRVGYLAAEKSIALAVKQIQSHLSSNVCTFAQYGGVSCYDDQESAKFVRQIVKDYQESRDLMLQMFAEIPNIRCTKPGSTFYCFPDVSHFGLTSENFCDRLLNEFHVSAVPGSVFGSDNNIRLLFAVDRKVIEKGLNRLKKFTESLC